MVSKIATTAIHGRAGDNDLGDLPYFRGAVLARVLRHTVDLPKAGLRDDSFVTVMDKNNMAAADAIQARLGQKTHTH